MSDNQQYLIDKVQRWQQMRPDIQRFIVPHEESLAALPKRHIRIGAIPNVHILVRCVTQCTFVLLQFAEGVN